LATEVLYYNIFYGIFFFVTWIFDQIVEVSGVKSGIFTKWSQRGFLNLRY